MKTYSKEAGHSIPGIDDGWAVYGKAKGEPVELLAVVDTETIAEGLIALLKQSYLPRMPFARHELGRTYVEPKDRFIVSLIVGYNDKNDGSGVKTPQEAVAAALALTTDGDSGGTQWWCYDRKLKKLYMVEQADAAGETAK